MLRNFVLVALFAMFLVPAAAQAQFDEGDWAMTIAGSGASDEGFDNNAMSVNFSAAYFFNDNLSAGVRQGVSFTESDDESFTDPETGVTTSIGGESDFSGSTTGFVDYHFDLDEWQPYVGAFIGYQYGDAVDDDGVYGPEVGVKYFVNSTTFIDFNVQYQIGFDSDTDESWSYALGLGWRS